MAQPLLSALNLANDSHSLFLLQHWGVRAEADGIFHGSAHRFIPCCVLSPKQLSSMKPLHLQQPSLEH